MSIQDIDRINSIFGKKIPFPVQGEIKTELHTKAATVLRNGGKLSRSLPGYQERQAQIEMAKNVERAIMQQSPCVLEAATGTGKSLGYTIPAVLTGVKAIISTASKALQDQLFDKDIPFVQKHVLWFEAAQMKGKNNYLCLDRMQKYGMQAAANSENDRAYRRIRATTEDPTFEGDFEKIGFYVKDDLKSEINVDADQCAGSKCNFYQKCYFYQQKRKLKTAQVIVVNHHLLLQDALSGERVLPARDVVIIDEAHKLEEAATDVFTTEIRQTRVTSLLKLKRLNVVPGDTLYVANRQCDQVWQRLAEFFPRGMLVDTAPLNEPIEEGLHLATSLEAIQAELVQRRPQNVSEKEGELYDKTIKRTERLASDIRKVFKVESSDNVYYLKREKKGDKVHISVLMVPLDVSSFLKSQLFDKNNAICTSATLAAPDFQYFRQRTGMDDERTIERILPLVFDYRRNALLYIPDDIPKYEYGNGIAAKNYRHAIGERMFQLVQLSQGRAFLLFSSKDMMNTVYSQIAGRLNYPLFKQGDSSISEIKSQFGEAGNGVLFGLKSFWEGVDIAGDALSLVIIDKLPNNPPSDPVHAARRKRVEESGRNGYVFYDQPQVITKLKQGVGRLIRTDTDRGVMAILDVRTNSSIRKAMPPAVQTSNLRDVERFFNEGKM